MEKMLKKTMFLSCVVGAMCLLCSCISRPGGITSSTIPISASDSYTVVQNNVSGKSWTMEILGFIPLSPVSAYSALQAAKEDNGCDGLINVSANSEWKWFILFSYYKIEVRGDAIKLKHKTR
jgi:hypothetical protein